MEQDLSKLITGFKIALTGLVFTLLVLFVGCSSCRGPSNETLPPAVGLSCGDPCARPITVTTEEPAVPSAARPGEAATPDTSEEETEDAQKERCRPTNGCG